MCSQYQCRDDWAHFDDDPAHNKSLIPVNAISFPRWPQVECDDQKSLPTGRYESVVKRTDSIPVRPNQLSESVTPGPTVVRNLHSSAQSGLSPTSRSHVPIAPALRLNDPCISDAADMSASKSVTDHWTPNTEQKTYYLSQFLRMQPDLRAKLGGLQAKAFFELSRLPTTELSDIWELADTDRDGQLTLGEFCVAMHLVVLRRNGFPVPPVLPPSLNEVISSHSLLTLAPTKTGLSHGTHISIEPSMSYTHACFPDSRLTSTGSPLTPSGLTPTSFRQRRWSISSQSDISSLAEGILQFESKPNVDPQLQHPIPLRARTLPLNSNDTVLPVPHLTLTRPTPLHPPPPPPRAHIRYDVNKEVIPSVLPSTPVANDMPAPSGYSPLVEETNIPQNTDFTFSKSIELPSTHMTPSTSDSPSVTDAVVAQLCNECDEVTQMNEQLSIELMQLQQQRISLEILFERLMPLDTTYPANFASHDNPV